MDPSEGNLQGIALHEALHESGAYHAIHPFQQSSVSYAPLLHSIRTVERTKNTRITSVLDIGCGVGWGVKALWALNYVASGVDSSPYAISQATKRLVDSRDRSQQYHCILQQCFIVASITKIPYPRQAPDAILCAGLMEHIDVRDVNFAISEIVRVARHYLFIQIATHPQMPTMSSFRIPSRGNSTVSNIITKNYFARTPVPIERTLKPRMWWVSKFEKAGFIFIQNIPLPSPRCCAFVLKRNVSIKHPHVTSKLHRYPNTSPKSIQ